MGFRINTNIAAMNAHANSVVNNRSLDNSLGRLSSGLRIQTAADDASGLAIADSLRSQASSLGQAIANGNDAIGIIKIADKAMDEQLKLLDTIKAKAVQAAQDGQTTESRRAIQNDIVRLMESLDNIGNTTSFNGQKLLSGTFINKEFQVGAYSNESVKATIGATTSNKIGLTRFETGASITASSEVKIKFINTDGVNDYEIESAVISTSVGTGIGVLAENINKVSDKTGIRATYNVQTTGKSAVQEGSTTSAFAINGVIIGKVDYKNNDSTGALVAAINAVKDTTGVEASVDSRGHLNLTSRDGRGIKIEGLDKAKDKTGISGQTENYGRLSLTRLSGNDIIVSGGKNGKIGFETEGKVAQKTVSLREIKGVIEKDVASAMGFNANANVEFISTSKTAGVTTLKGAMAVMNIAETAIKNLDSIRADLGSVQNQITSTVNNISVTQVNVKSAESQIRDVDFASESAEFSKFNILAQSGSYAMSQANAVQQNVLRLLQ
ncbi:flagellin B [Campylobacter sputorum subsp. bubulus]|uniref:Flagellin n=1 Tax=Campylobacter sputorum subsp. sputorum TaxID=32024 RepID=A0A381DKB7_9BACT|nr:flagellin B [Campylobacter sputorum]ASM34456.1 flagellin [Campylobacter sputorum aubsp. sputorum RM3237]KAB0582155.1 flagellin B [Campylobacter sputorum subsp. sputorum]QEL04647.1 flagellin [Campylobacter sputorum subsp. sputorum]SUX09471.1 flagellin B [Campylobacter sputorum subsp. bubulus]SUX11119.1 flagellin B [Campylobacter sputorum subsp. sputorum]